MSKLELFLRRRVARRLSQMMLERQARHRFVAAHYFDFPPIEFVEKHPNIGGLLGRVWWKLCDWEVSLGSFIYRACIAAFLGVATRPV